VAIGAGSVADAPDTLSVGDVGAERKIVNVAAGTIAASSTDGVNGGQLYTTNQNLAAEAISRASADTTLQGNIDAEASTRASADATLQGDIDAEASTRAAADTTLQGNIDSEASTRAAADTTLQGNIDAEASTRATADATLQGNIDAEASTRASADAGLQGNIDAEAAARVAAYDLLEANLTGETVARIVADQAQSVQIGALNNRLDGPSIAFGTSSSATTNAVAIGVGQMANGNGAVAIGDPNNAMGTGAVAIGADNAAIGNGAIAIGNMSIATGEGAVGLGNGSVALGNGTVAIGLGSTANELGIAIGNSASNASFNNSVALGANSTNTADNQVTVGGRTVTGVNDGAVAADSTDAVNGSQLFQMNQAISQQASAMDFVDSQLSSMANQVAELSSDIGNLYELRDADRRDMKQGIAGAIAMANAPFPSEPGGVSYAINGAAFRGEYAVGGAVSYRLNRSAPTAVSVGFSYAGNKNNGVRIGVAGEF
jgi:autotransporter adhesin